VREDGYELVVIDVAYIHPPSRVSVGWVGEDALDQTWDFVNAHSRNTAH
jgi:hypothetical protein